VFSGFNVAAGGGLGVVVVVVVVVVAVVLAVILTRRRLDTGVEADEFMAAEAAEALRTVQEQIERGSRSF
jgi:uncharacterized membrane protein